MPNTSKPDDEGFEVPAPQRGKARKPPETQLTPTEETPVPTPPAIPGPVPGVSEDALLSEVIAANRAAVSKFIGLLDKAKERCAEWDRCIRTDSAERAVIRRCAQAATPEEFSLRRSEWMALRDSVESRAVAGLTRRVVDLRRREEIAKLFDPAVEVANLLKAGLVDALVTRLREEEAFFGGPSSDGRTPQSQAIERVLRNIEGSILTFRDSLGGRPRIEDFEALLRTQTPTTHTIR